MQVRQAVTVQLAFNHLSKVGFQGMRPLENVYEVSRIEVNFHSISLRAWSRFLSLFNPLIERLEHPRIHGSNHIDGSIQLFYAHPCFSCIRKATIHSRITEAYHRDRQPDQHFLTVGKAFGRVRLTIKGSKICFFQGSLL